MTKAQRNKKSREYYAKNRERILARRRELTLEKARAVYEPTLDDEDVLENNHYVKAAEEVASSKIHKRPSFIRRILGLN